MTISTSIMANRIVEKWPLGGLRAAIFKETAKPLRGMDNNVNCFFVVSNLLAANLTRFACSGPWRTSVMWPTTLRPCWTWSSIRPCRPTSTPCTWSSSASASAATSWFASSSATTRPCRRWRICSSLIWPCRTSCCACWLSRSRLSISSWTSGSSAASCATWWPIRRARLSMCRPWHWLPLPSIGFSSFCIRSSLAWRWTCASPSSAASGCSLFAPPCPTASSSTSSTWKTAPTARRAGPLTAIGRPSELWPPSCSSSCPSLS